MKVIFYIDMNAFFASCHQVIDPRIVSKPIVVSSQSRRAIVASANYEARKYNIKTAMPLYQAKALCPTLICININRKLYIEYSHKIFNLLVNNFTNKVEITSIDEYCLDATNIYLQYNNAFECAKAIQNNILNSLNLPCSIGISYNKFLAKMASKVNKPLGIFIFKPHNIKTKLWPLDIKELSGIGKKTTEKLKNININTIGDFANSTNNWALQEIIGKGYFVLQQIALGKTSNINDQINFQEQKSISHDLTFEYDTENIDEIKQYLLDLTCKVVSRAKSNSLVGKIITFAFKTNRTQWTSKRISLTDYTNDIDTIYSSVLYLFETIWNYHSIRAIRINLGKTVNQYDLNIQLELFNPALSSEKKSQMTVQETIIKKINRQWKQEISMTGKKYLDKIYSKNNNSYATKNKTKKYK
ncbi:Y-family DNA polymerase [Spiroplasma endosymbiont of Tipula paludosa]|uniref:Y-family DNA polymerase n=1 Tax=Spiroplasma endosymbiont of Tipula paludosa TaxID=3066295 RepID=UPI0035C8E885